MRKVCVSLTLLLFLVATVFVITNDSIGGLKKKGDKGQRLAKPMTITRPVWTPNRIANYITNNGQLVSHIPTSSAGMEWPAGSLNTINFASGIWVAGKKNGEIVASAGEYVVEFQPGPILPNGQATDPNAPQYRIYTINQSDFDDPSQNPDFAAWPYDDGAPFTLAADGSRMPALLGTSMTWCVYNDLDEILHSRLFSTKPLGIEVQQTAWGFNRPDAFGDMLFFKFVIINKGGVDVTDTYVSFWADIDIGDAADLVGSDTTISLGYMYKTQADGLYGTSPPAIGYDFFQGPIVPSPGDTANVSGRRIPDFKNLPMSSFAKYINAGPTQYRDPETGPEAYNFMLGLDRAGDPIVNPQTNQVTKFWHAGDPVTGSGWLDDTHGDKRFLMTSGPFTLAAGDTQEVVGGMLIAQGSDAPSTISILRQADQSAQAAYDNNFVLPRNPPAPTVEVTVEKDAILLKWDDRAETYEEVDKFHTVDGVPTNYRFQGYNVYQTDELTLGTTTTVKKIATFDIMDGNFQDIKDFVLDAVRGEFVEVTVQKPRDTGVFRYLRITQDAVRGNQPLIPNRRYYFAVTAYGYNQEGFEGNAGGPYAIESTLRPFLTIPVSEKLGDLLTTPAGDTLAITHANPGPIPSDGSVYPKVVEPEDLTGHDYHVSFRSTEDGPVWDLTDDTDNVVKVSGWVNQGDTGPGDFPIVDGFVLQVFGPPLAAKSAEFLPNDGARWFTGNNWGGDLLSGGLGLGVNFFGSNITPDQYIPVEIRFRTNADGQRAYMYLRGGTPNYGYISYEPQHFTVWDVTPGQPERQLNAAYVEQAGEQNNLWDPSVAASRNYLFILNSTYSDTPDPYYTSRTALGQAAEFDVLYSIWPVLRGGHTLEWADGQVYKITPNFVNTEKDVFSFKTKAAIKNDVALAKQQAKLVNVFPNPYVGYNIEERDPVNRFVTFTHLTPTAKIRIFTLAGELVKTIEHTDGTQLQRWDLRNASDVPVASGIYIAHIELPNVGQKVLKLAVFQPEERLDVF
ncbi:T9SS type A sorting domain-containing protein [candidate division KSB1 bacterium]|nr:T9SS type A sorting domain-containing protein [candidate division KSB1 bacterium]